VNKEKSLRKLRESTSTIDAINLDLSYCAVFNLAVSLEANGMIQEALTKYTEIIKSKQFQHAGRLRVNMGNIYFQQKKYLNAIKMYRMALDIIPQTSKVISVMPLSSRVNIKKPSILMRTS
jgi:intraflagellar transport protein 88